MRMESAVAGQPPLISLVVPVYNAGAWLDEAMANYQRAVSMDPGNVEYRQAYNMMQQGGQAYRSNGYSTGADAMDCCTTLMCLNCLCGGGGRC